MSIIIDRPNGIELFRLKAAISMIKLEKLGMKHSSGRSMKTFYARSLNLRPRAKHDEVIAAIENLIKEIEQKGDLGIREV